MHLRAFITFYCILSVLPYARTEDRDGLMPKSRSPVIQPIGDVRCESIECNISCFNGETNSLFFDINWAHSKNKENCKAINQLLIQNYTFEDQTIPHKWSPSQYKIKTLKIVSSNIQNIEPGAFFYNDLSELVLENLQLKQLVGGTLSGLKELKKLTIIQKTVPIEFVSHDFLKPVQFTLTELKMNAEILAPDNLTNSCALLNTLEKVDLSYNNFNMLGPKAFSKLSLVEDLDLSNSKITLLSKGVFAELSATLRNLDLSHNYIKTFDDLVFKPPITSVRVNLKLDGNPWKCSCELQLLVKTVSVHDAHKITCLSPLQFLGKALVLANVCIGRPGRIFNKQYRPKLSESTAVSNTVENSSSITSVSTTESTKPEEEKAPDTPSFGNDGRGLMKLKCLVCEAMYCNNTKKSEFKTIRVRPRKVEFAISMLTDSTVMVTILSSMKEPHALIWFSKVTKEFFKMEINYKEYGLGCLRNVSKSIVVNDLSANSTYTFCMINMDFTTTSPFNCMAYRAPTYISRHNIWLSESMKALCISLMLLVIFCSMFLGGCIVFCIIKKKPTLLRGSKRVILPKKSSVDIMVLPRCGSLSKCEIKSTNNESVSSQRCLHLRRSSCDSIDSSYVSPHLYEIIPAAANRPTKGPDEVDICTSLGYLHRTRTKRTSNDPLPSIPVQTLPGLEIIKRHGSGSSA